MASWSHRPWDQQVWGWLLCAMLLPPIALWMTVLWLAGSEKFYDAPSRQFFALD